MREDAVVVVVGRMINRNEECAYIGKMKKLSMEWHDDKTIKHQTKKMPKSIAGRNLRTTNRRNTQHEGDRRRIQRHRPQWGALLWWRGLVGLCWGWGAREDGTPGLSPTEFGDALLQTRGGVNRSPRRIWQGRECAKKLEGEMARRESRTFVTVLRAISTFEERAYHWLITPAISVSTAGHGRLSFFWATGAVAYRWGGDVAGPFTLILVVVRKKRGSFSAYIQIRLD